MMVIPACAEEKYSEFPKALRMTQKRVKNEITNASYIMTHYPRTNVKAVDAALDGGYPRNEVYRAKVKIKDMFEE